MRKQQAEAGDIVLLYGDESEALTHPYLARAWAKAGSDLRVPAPGQAKKVAMLGSLDHVSGQLIVHTSPTKRSSDFVAHLEQLDRLYGPRPGQPIKPVVLVEDNGPIHTSKLSLAALAARAHWLTVEWLPKYAPELNDIEPVWRDLKAHHLAHQTFADPDALDQEIHQAVAALNRRTHAPSVGQATNLTLTRRVHSTGETRSGIKRQECARWIKNVRQCDLASNAAVCSALRGSRKLAIECCSYWVDRRLCAS